MASEDVPPDKPDSLRPPASGTADALAIPTPHVPFSVQVTRPKEPRPLSSSPPRAPSSRPPPPDDPRSEGGRSFLEELVRAPLDALAATVPDPLPLDRQQRIDAMVNELARAGPEVDGPTRERVLALGPEVLPALARVFPGALWVDLSRPHRPLRSARTLSALASAMLAFGDAAVPHLAALLRSPRPEVRLSACITAIDLVHGELVQPLAARLHDQVRPVRDAAMMALRAAAALPEARILRSELALTLTDRDKPAHWRHRAAWTMGQLRDTEAVPHLIEELSAEPAVADAVRAALVRIAGQDHGRFRFRWRRWWAEHGERERVEWLIDALDQPEPDTRRRAIDELVLLTGEGFDRREAAITREASLELAEHYRTWVRARRS